MTKLTEEQLHFAEFLKLYHFGKDNAIVTKRLRQFGNGVAIREMVHALRVSGFPICSGNTGYYYAQDSDELERTLNFLNSHIKQVMEAFEGLNDSYYMMKHEELISDKKPIQKRLF